MIRFLNLVSNSRFALFLTNEIQYTVLHSLVNVGCVPSESIFIPTVLYSVMFTFIVKPWVCARIIRF